MTDSRSQEAEREGRTAVRGLATLAACLLGLLASAALAVPAARADAEPGDLDESFSDDGYTNPGFSSTGGARAYDVAIANNLIAAAGRDGASDGRFALGIFTMDGDLFTRATTAFGQSDRARGVAWAGGAIVSAGVASSSSGGDRSAFPTDDDDFALSMHNALGAPVFGFGDRGKVTKDIHDGAFARAVAVQPNGKIVVAGSVFQEDTFPGSIDDDYDVAVARYDPDNGSLDQTFDGDGIVITGFNHFDFAEALAIQPDGKIVVAGTRCQGEPVAFGCANGDTDLILARYRTNGSLDPTFDGDGRVVTGFGDFENAASVAIQPDGKIVVAGSEGSTGAAGEFGYVSEGTTNLLLTRYTPNGSLDSSFSGDGRKSTGFSAGIDYASGVAIQADGKIVAAGRTASGGGNVALTRYRPNGSLDSSFGGDGKVTLGLGGNEEARGIAIQPDGKIVIAGRTSLFNGRFLIARYHAEAVDTTPPETTIESGPPDPTNDPAPTFEFGASEAGSTFGCKLDDGSFTDCSSTQTFGPLEDGEHSLAVRATDRAGNTDSTPAIRDFTVDTAVRIGIRGKRVRLRGRRARVRLACPGSELSGPCAGKLKLKTRKRVRFRGKRRRVVLARRNYSVGAGEAKRVRLRLSRAKVRLIRRQRRARAARTIARVGDGAGNSAGVAKRMRVKP